ncbi:ParA family protein [Stenotrophomonas maltophilia]|uniref:ParA family protein n=1 Tax=Stenotrophomonas maltophilia TaxID=40324 RepID=UPI0013DAA6B4|nr:ParA family protein [Stenotrophomonas maltophilia]
MAKPVKQAPVVAVLNMKGGVGKTVVSAHVMRVLYRILAKNVLLIDFDPQFNLTQTVMNQNVYEKHKKSKRTILEVMEPAAEASLFKVSAVLPPAPQVDEVAVLLKRLVDDDGAVSGTLKLVPGDFGLVKYSLIEEPKSLAPIRKRFKEFVDNARSETDLVCIDCNPSSSFMTLCALSVATHLLIPVKPDRFSILGLELLDTFVEGLPTLVKKPKQIIVLNDVLRAGGDPAVENILRSHPKFGGRTLATPLYHSGLIAANPSYTGFATDKPVANRFKVNDNIEKLANEIGKELGLI